MMAMFNRNIPIGFTAVSSRFFKMFSKIVVAGFVLSGSFAMAAAQFQAQGRLFVGSTSADPSNLNDEMNTLGLKEFKSITQYGAEITYPVLSILDVGMRYHKIYTINKEVTETVGADYRAILDQDAVMFVARVPFLKTQLIHMDVFGAVGGTNTTLNLKTSSQTGEITRREANDWFASVVSSFGGSIAIGYKSVFLVIEGGVETNKVDSLKRADTLNANIQNINLSGSYVTVGLMFDGINAYSK